MSSISEHAQEHRRAAGRDHDDRIAYLDGLRGVAVVLVVLFHSYTRWTSLIPALKPFENVLVLNTKSAGVQLFFFISGFVILMTLERSKGFGSFLFARWRRLFPAMLIMSVMIYASASFLPERPAGQPRFVDLLPGLSLLGDRFWDILRFWMPSPPHSLEGSFWSLYVEVFFYQFFAILFLAHGAKRAIAALIVVGVITSVFDANMHLGDSASITLWRIGDIFLVSHLAWIFGLWHYTWFAAGALACLWTRTPGDKRLLWGAVGCLVFGVATTPEYPVASGLVVAIAVAAILSPRVQRLLSLRVFTFLGFISYPLYLGHENMIVALTIRIQAHWPWMPAILMPVLPIALAIVIATLVAKYAEPFTRRMIDVLIARLRTGIRTIEPAEASKT